MRGSRRNNYYPESKELRTQLYKLDYFRSKNQIEQFKMFYGRNPKAREGHVAQSDAKARSSDVFSNLNENNRAFDRNQRYSLSYLHTPGITYGVRPGLGKPIEQFCDCTKTGQLNRIAPNSIVMAIVSIQYLTLMCTRYCVKNIKQRNLRAKQATTNGQWKPSYIPYAKNETLFKDISYGQISNRDIFFNPKNATLEKKSFQNEAISPINRNKKIVYVIGSYNVASKQVQSGNNTTAVSLSSISMLDDDSISTQRDHISLPVANNTPLNLSNKSHILEVALTNTGTTNKEENLESKVIPLTELSNSVLSLPHGKAQQYFSSKSVVDNTSDWNSSGHIDKNSVSVTNLVPGNNSTSITTKVFRNKNIIEGKKIILHYLWFQARVTSRIYMYSQYQI